MSLTLENAPLGTKAPAIGGGAWTKTERGWQWNGGSTFPRPGGDWNGHLIPPPIKDRFEIPAFCIVLPTGFESMPPEAQYGAALEAIRQAANYAAVQAHQILLPKSTQSVRAEVQYIPRRN